jgi:hypothetical protein
VQRISHGTLLVSYSGLAFLVKRLESEVIHEKQPFYQITVKGELDPDWSDWLNGFDVHTTISADGICSTILTGLIVDQAALRGVLNKIWDLNLELDALSRFDGPFDQDLSYNINK